MIAYDMGNARNYRMKVQQATIDAVVAAPWERNYRTTTEKMIG